MKYLKYIKEEKSHVNVALKASRKLLFFIILYCLVIDG